MKIVTLLAMSILPFLATAQTSGSQYFEMRTYHCHPGKRPDLIKRFQDHTMRLFKRHGIENIAYFLPTDTADNSLVFILGYPEQSKRDTLWNAFANDPEWQAAAKKSEANGPLVQKVDQVFMTFAPELSTSIKASKLKDAVFHLRRYYCLPGRLTAIDARFRDHTRKLFEKHGMVNMVYFHTVEKDGKQPDLVYLLAHPSQADGIKSFETFRNDPDWQRVRDASEASGKIVEKIDATYLKPLPFSPLK